MIKLVILDLDGTLYDYNYCNKIAEKKLQEEVEKLFGIEEENFYLLYEQAKKDVKRNLGDTASAHNRLLYMQRLCELVLKKPFCYAMHLYNTYWENMLEHMTCFSYVLPLLEKLSRLEIKVGILTDLTAHIQYRKIERLNIGRYIDFIVTSEEVGIEKPSENMFQTILKKANCRADEAIMIGDSLSRDIMGAQKVGIHAIQYIPEIDIVGKVMDLL